jgi:hypothetical protein
VKTQTLLLLALPALHAAAGDKHFDVEAAFVPAPKPGAPAVVAIRFTATDPAVHVNADPAPRFKLDPQQTVLVDQSLAPAKPEPTARYLDSARFPVAIASGAPKGLQSAKGTLTYFYCSKREGWCRKGSAELEIPVLVP